MTEPAKLDLKSMSITDDQKAKLKQLFPEVVSESRIDFDKLKRTIGEEIDTGEERFGITWPGKNDCFKVIQTQTVGTLKPAQEESINWDTTDNLFIEGDNLEVLKLLQGAYYGKIKMIYIDPPYNTGKEFIYPDNYTESLDTYLTYTGQANEDGQKVTTNAETSGRFHSKWLNMMYPRLFLAKNLLREDGVIFISIDDNEVHNLKMIMNEVFGEENFIATIVWQHSIQPKGYLGLFSVHHNFILCYQKGCSFNLGALERTEEHNKSYSNPDNDPKGLWRTGDVRNALYRPNLIYDIQTPSGKIIKPSQNGWRWSKDTIKKKIESGEIIFSKDETRIIRKIYLNNVEGRTPETIWFGKEVGTTRDAVQEIKELFDNTTPFETPKPVNLIRRMLEISGLNEDGDIVLDYFAGSCTTAHAVMALNAEDDGNRKFICVQLPEPCQEDSEAFKAGYKTISEIGKERIRRVIKKVQEGQVAKEKEAEGKLPGMSEGNAVIDLGFKVFKLDKSNFRLWNGSVDESSDVSTQIEMFIDHIDPNASDEDILYEILLKTRFPLTKKIEEMQLAGKKVYSIAEKALLICLDRKLTKDVITEMARLQPARVVCLDVGFAGNDQLKTNAVQIMKSHGVEDFRTV